MQSIWPRNQTSTVTSPTVIGSVFMRRFRLLFGTVYRVHHLQSTFSVVKQSTFAFSVNQLSILNNKKAKKRKSCSYHYNNNKSDSDQKTNVAIIEKLSSFLVMAVQSFVVKVNITVPFLKTQFHEIFMLQRLT